MPAKNQTRVDDDRVDFADDSADISAGEPRDPQFSDAQLRGVDSFDAAMALVTEAYGDVLDAAEEIGSGFTKLENKNRLVGLTFLIVTYTFSDGDFRDENGFLQKFVSVRIVTRTGEKLWFTDGGTGIYRQLEDLSVRSGRNGGVLVTDGLRVSEYTWIDDKGNEQPGVTHYLNV